MLRQWGEAAISLTGLSGGIVPGFQNTTGSTLADMLRLNVAVPPATSPRSRLGIIGGDLAGFRNGRRVDDDVVAIELRAIAGLTVPLVDPTFTPDPAAPWSSQESCLPRIAISPRSDLGPPHDGFSTPPV